MGLLSCQEMLEEKRIRFAAKTLSNAEDKKVFRVMMEEKEEKGEWWKTLEKDMEKYEIESCENLVQLEQQNLLKKYMDEMRKKSVSDALPDS